MNNKKLKMYLIIVFLILIILIVGLIIHNKNNDENKIINSEYIPEEEITDKQLRTTIVSLYFLDKNNLELMPEIRQIDAKELINNAPEKLINLLIEGPKNDNLIRLIPENTKINSIKIIDNVLYLDLSDDFIKDQTLGEIQEKLIINSIVNTVTQLNEINKLKILINGEENKSFPDGCVNFNKEFIKE